MKPYFYLLILIIFTACSKNSDDKNCKFLLDVSVNVTINLNLPQYNQLNSIGNSVYVANAGNGGVIVTNAGSGFLAWDAADPNHTPTSCSIVSGSGLEGTCGCTDANKYSFVTGQPLENSTLQCGLRNYRVEQNGNTLLIFN
ncbi:hypothetical protein [Hwangdonia seohaensis]|uniref:Uncharacterized protein n=1 Tax=Hwangdonia seohaensis TaxID=1240727 RepID=A0ABW3R959_9FLAO|nr:hypothetical protein [Hwangdonia seohaensis]